MDEQNQVDPTVNPSADQAGETILPIGSRMGDVKAETVVIRQGVAQTIQAARVNVRQGATVQLKAERAEVVQGAMVSAQADKLTLGPGAAALGVLADSVKVEQSLVRVMVSRGPMEMEQSGAIAVIAPTATVKSSMVGLLFARKVEGDVKAMFGPRAAVAFGAAFGAAFGVAFALARGLKRGRRR